MPQMPTEWHPSSQPAIMNPKTGFSSHFCHDFFMDGVTINR